MRFIVVHRDADREPREVRVNEISRALAEAQLPTMLPAICVVPVRMQEAWLLFDEAAIRKAAGNPRGRESIALPDVADIEDLDDPKATLHELIRIASGRHGRRLKQLSVHKCVHLVADWIEEFTPLRALPAFRALEADVRQKVLEQGWSR